MANPSLRELDLRLREQRGAFADTAAAIRRRMRRELHELAPQRQLRRHAGAAMVTTALVGLVAGRIAGRILAALF